MTRIVAGLAGGRRLGVPGKGTRPTSERVREALFSRLEHLDVLDGARVLDLYAGSGALGLEAASRGAAVVTLVEQARAAAEVCRANVAAVGLPGVQVVVERAERFVQRPVAEPWDLVLIDPPYEVGEVVLADLLRDLAPSAPAALVVVERSSRSPEPTWPPGTVRTDRRAYGETIVWFAVVGDQAGRIDEPAARADDQTDGGIGAPGAGDGPGIP